MAEKSILDKVFNTANKAFEAISKIEVDRWQAKRLGDIRRSENEVSKERIIRFVNPQSSVNVTQPFNNSTLIAAGFLGVAVLLIATK